MRYPQWDPIVRLTLCESNLQPCELRTTEEDFVEQTRSGRNFEIDAGEILQVKPSHDHRRSMILS